MMFIIVSVAEWLELVMLVHMSQRMGLSRFEPWFRLGKGVFFSKVLGRGGRKFGAKPRRNSCNPPKSNAEFT